MSRKPTRKRRRRREAEFAARHPRMSRHKDHGTGSRRRLTRQGLWGQYAPHGRHIPKFQRPGGKRRTINRTRKRRDVRGRFR